MNEIEWAIKANKAMIERMEKELAKPERERVIDGSKCKWYIAECKRAIRRLEARK